MDVSTFAVGLVKLIVGDILPNIADDLKISLAIAGQLITVLALVYALSESSYIKSSMTYNPFG